MTELQKITIEVEPTSFDKIAPPRKTIKTITEELLKELDYENGEQLKRGLAKQGNREYTLQSVITDIIEEEIGKLSFNTSSNDEVNSVNDLKLKNLLRQEIKNISTLLEFSSKTDNRYFILGLVLRSLY